MSDIKVLYSCGMFLQSTGCCDDDGYSSGYSVKVSIHAHRIFSKTPKGVWLGRCGKEKFVLLSGKKRYAYPTKGEAIASFKARKVRQIAILKTRLRDAQRALEIDPKDYLDCSEHWI